MQDVLLNEHPLVLKDDAVSWLLDMEWGFQGQYSWVVGVFGYKRVLLVFKVNGWIDSLVG